MLGRSPQTIRGYRGRLRFYCRYSGLRDIQEVTNKNLREFLFDGRLNRGWRTHTFIGFVRVFSVFFKWCMENHYLSENPVTGIELPKVEYRLPVKLNKQEALKLLEVVFNYPYDYPYLRYRNHAIFSMFVFAGLRKTELLKLRMQDVDLENMTIFVNQGKGSKDRIIPMNYTLAESLRLYLRERKRLSKTCPQFFASLNRNMGFTEVGLKRLIEKIRIASGLKFSAHKLRHTFATLMLEGGCDIYSLSRMMGHSDIKTTTIYLSASAEHLRSQVGKHPLNDVIHYH